MTHRWLPLPTEQVLYSGLPTDYYPWTEVYSDVSAQPRFSGVLEVRQDRFQGRSVWVAGELRGSYAPGGDLDLRTLSSIREFARGSVSLSVLDPVVAQLVWQCREGEQAELPLPWPDARDLLADRRFRGALLSNSACSFWDDGRLLSGALPQPGERLMSIVPPRRLPSGGEAVQGLPGLQTFWNELLRVGATRMPVAALWHRSATALADEHPCLDPFAREVGYDQAGLQVNPDVPPAELHAAMRELYRALLAQSGVSLRSLPLTELRQHPLWASAGLEE